MILTQVMDGGGRWTSPYSCYCNVSSFLKNAIALQMIAAMHKTEFYIEMTFDMPLLTSDNREHKYFRYLC